MTSSRIVVAGSLNADLTIYCERLPSPGETLHGNGFAVNPGGKSANQAVSAAKLGGNVTLLGAVGQDPNGDMLVASTAGAGVDVSHVRRVAEPTGVAVISVEHAARTPSSSTPAPTAPCPRPTWPRPCLPGPAWCACAWRSRWRPCRPPRRPGTTPGQQSC